MVKESFEFDGLKQLDQLLSKLPVDVQAKILREINRKGAKIVQDAMVQGTPHESLKDNIKIKADKYNKSGILVGMDADGYVARYLEYGTKQRTTKSGENRGEIIADPFIKEAIDNSIQDALDYIRDHYAELINKSLERRVRAINKKLKL